MTSYEFEVAAKNAIIRDVKEKYGENYTIKDIDVVWMAHMLHNKKGIFIDSGKNLRLYEVTYNKDRNEIYLDMYEKQAKKVIPANEFNFNT